ncbi:protein HEXIM2-like [Pollicipes pollicipes]|uniref:protein HEXIM2-like n=1 Tax=Pollicipes pollicipes TaxID=41117 RepID=UPI001884F044|nr:protein HEXIM2-like [Pollicipes pollicipes]XP_037068353.1 protein HEXIM2-like [Pollicipes pollicipes]XP_037068794.1 protein HEXIM2-like [Pollicipes pollicipes]
MATSPAADVVVTGTPSSVPADGDDFLALDAPDEDKDFSLLIESSKTGDLSSALRCDTGAPTKRKKTRRGKKKQRHGPTDGGTSAGASGKDGATIARPGDEAVAAPAGDEQATPAVPHKKPRLNRRQRRRRSGRQPAPILRPLEVPRAPLNSTSFIIDDHENSAFYIDFDAVARRTPNGPSDGGSQLESSTADDEDEEEAAYQFSMKDFENVYRHAREEELSQLERPELVECVRSLETRVRELEAQLTLYDPEVWVTNLQNQLLHLQEENRLLNKTREALQKKYGNET